jgi:hypothetical protein
MDAVTPSRIVAVSTYLQGEFPSGSITIVESNRMDARLFRVDLGTGANPYDVLVFNEVLRVLTETTIPERFRAWNVSSLMRVAIGTVEVSLQGPSIRRRE